MNEAFVARSDAQLTPFNQPPVALEAQRTIKTTGGILYGLVVKNTGPAQFIQIHDANSVGALGASIPVVSADLPAAATVTIDLGVYGLGCLVGITVANSTTPLARTAGAADCLFFPRFK